MTALATETEPAGPRQRVLWLSTLAFTLLFAVWLMLGVLGIKIREELQLTPAQFDWLLTVAILAGSLPRLHFGIWADRFGGRLMMTLTLLFTAIPTFCHLCQLVLAHGTPAHNDAIVIDHAGASRVFCSEPCRWLFEREPERYAAHEDIVARVLAGKAPGNLVEFLTRYSGLSLDQWGKDAHGGRYPWLHPREDD